MEKMAESESQVEVVPETLQLIVRSTFSNSWPYVEDPTWPGKMDSSTPEVSSFNTWMLRVAVQAWLEELVPGDWTWPWGRVDSGAQILL